MVIVSVLSLKTRKLGRELAWWKPGAYTVQTGKALKTAETASKQSPKPEITLKQGD